MSNIIKSIDEQIKAIYLKYIGHPAAGIGQRIERLFTGGEQSFQKEKAELEAGLKELETFYNSFKNKLEADIKAIEAIHAAHPELKATPLVAQAITQVDTAEAQQNVAQVEQEVKAQQQAQASQQTDNKPTTTT